MFKNPLSLIGLQNSRLVLRHFIGLFPTVTSANTVRSRIVSSMNTHNVVDEGQEVSSPPLQSLSSLSGRRSEGMTG